MNNAKSFEHSVTGIRTITITENESLEALNGKLDALMVSVADSKDASDTQFNGVPSNVIDMIMDIHAEAMGSWSWDKRAGTLTMFDTHGLEAAVFSITDTPDVSSRERRTDLESS
jgi:hypothetical protein